MDRQLEQLKEFHTKVNSVWHDTPAVLGEDTRDFRVQLMKEELNEVEEAVKEGNIAHIAKELADLLYTVFGTIGAYGLADKIPAVFDEVHRSNMSKDVKGDSDTKAIKGGEFKEADVTSILNN
ncbi:MAG: hypothetical protein CMI56_01710 [Parcubacteria group bacterium]|jgi:predicted HAD superfamily Cof-like phosphohydrolase|nr:hypothetical protein [Parcubacteria group bacterium]|tara:strand:+ start:3852 stop:4220 length:369 start_codon:yes stop_codon:yes gene_type:complete